MEYTGVNSKGQPVIHICHHLLFIPERFCSVFILKTMCWPQPGMNWGGWQGPWGRAGRVLGSWAAAPCQLRAGRPVCPFVPEACGDGGTLSSMGTGPGCPCGALQWGPSRLHLVQRPGPCGVGDSPPCSPWTVGYWRCWLTPRWAQGRAQLGPWCCRGSGPRNPRTGPF